MYFPEHQPGNDFKECLDGTPTPIRYERSLRTSAFISITDFEWPFEEERRTMRIANTDASQGDLFNMSLESRSWPEAIVPEDSWCTS